MKLRAMLFAASSAALTVGCGGARAPDTVDGAALAATVPQGAQSRCRAADTLQSVPTGVYRACEVDQEVRPRGRTNPTQWEPSVPGIKDCYMAVVGFVVDEQGIPQPQTARIIRTNDPSFAGAILDALPSWRYSPAVKDGQPVRQWLEYRNSAAVIRVAAASLSEARSKARAARAPRC